MSSGAGAWFVATWWTERRRTRSPATVYGWPRRRCGASSREDVPGVPGPTAWGLEGGTLEEAKQSLDERRFLGAAYLLSDCELLEDRPPEHADQRNGTDPCRGFTRGTRSPAHRSNSHQKGGRKCSRHTRWTPRTCSPSRRADSRPRWTPSPGTTGRRASGSSRWWAPRPRSRRSGRRCSSSPRTRLTSSRGADGMALHGGYQRCVIPHETIGSWTTKIARLHSDRRLARPRVYEDRRSSDHEKDSFLLLAQSAEEAPALHHRFLDKRSPLPLPRLLGRTGSGSGASRREEIVPLQSRRRISAYRCSPKAQKLREDLSYAVASGRLTHCPREASDG